MSLPDVLLLDPYPTDVWVALRTDGVSGSGTESDPYDGSVKAAKPVLDGTGITYNSMLTEATASVPNHGYSNGDVVVISEVTGADANSYNGTYIIHGVVLNSFSYYLHWAPANNSAGAFKCTRDRYSYDAVVGRQPANTAIHIGPGVFETKGHGEVAVLAAQARSGQKIIGSGIDVTVLKLVGAAIPVSKYYVIGTFSKVDCFEVRDLTLDCNLAGQVIGPYVFPPISCAGIFASGSYLRYSRVRVINFGSLHPDMECFALWSAGSNPIGNPNPTGCVVEECIVEQPDLNNYSIINSIVFGGGERTTDGVMAWHTGCVIRNCVMDCAYRNNPVSIKSLTIATSTPFAATVITNAPHGRQTNDWVRIDGAWENGSPNTTYNGSYQITIDGTDPNKFTYTPYDSVVHPRPTVDASGDLWVDRFSSQAVAISNITDSPTTPPYTVTITTVTPHFRVPGNNVAVQLVKPLGYSDSFKVTGVPTPYQLTCDLFTNPGPLSDRSAAYVGVTFQAIQAMGGTGAVVEGNRILNNRFGVYHDTWSSKDLVIRNNTFRGVIAGVFENMPGYFPLVGPISFTTDALALVTGSLTRTGTTGFAETVLPNGFVLGDHVIISGVTGPTQTDADLYNGTHPITAVGGIKPNQFQFTLSGSPNPTPAGNPAYSTEDNQRRLKSLTSALESGLFAATGEASYLEHGLMVGDVVYVSKASRSQYNGYFAVTAVIPSGGGSNAKFKYVLPSDPGGSSTTGYYGRLWQVPNFVIENNWIELISGIPGGLPVGIWLYQPKINSPQFVFPHVVVRGNVIRMFENISDPQVSAVKLNNCGTAIVEDNVVDLTLATPIRHYNCGTVHYFNNLTSAGALILGVEENAGLQVVRTSDELTTVVEDALLAAF